MNFDLSIWWIKDCLVVFPHDGVLVIKTIYSTVVANREFKKIRRLLQRKRHIKIELCTQVKSFAITPCWSRCPK